MIHFPFALLVCVLGGVIFFATDEAKHPKMVKIGFATYWCGLLAFLLTFYQTFRIG
jgi:hypothetical protein